MRRIQCKETELLFRYLHPGFLLNRTPKHLTTAFPPPLYFILSRTLWGKLGRERVTGPKSLQKFPWQNRDSNWGIWGSSLTLKSLHYTRHENKGFRVQFPTSEKQSPKEDTVVKTAGMRNSKWSLPHTPPCAGYYVIPNTIILKSDPKASLRTEVTAYYD